MKMLKSILLIYTIALLINPEFLNAQYSEPKALFSTPLSGIEDFKVVDYNNDGVNDIAANADSGVGWYTYFLKGTKNGFEIDQRIQFDHIISAMTFYEFDNDGELDLHSCNFIYENDNSVYTCYQ